MVVKTKDKTIYEAYKTVYAKIIWANKNLII